MTAADRLLAKSLKIPPEVKLEMKRPEENAALLEV